MACKLTHPETDEQIEADASMVAMYESQGWEVVPAAPTVTKRPPAVIADDKKK